MNNNTLKYYNCELVFQEVPNEITLAFNVTGCTHHCEDCHSKFLWDDVGTEMTFENVEKEIIPYKDYITCVCFMGGDHNQQQLYELLTAIKEKYKVKIAFYFGCGLGDIDVNIIKTANYIKVGQYLKEFGGLDHKGTNQIFFTLEHRPNGIIELTDTTSHFYTGDKIHVKGKDN